VAADTRTPPKYPRTQTVGAQTLTFRLMEAGDKERVLAFSRALPHHDLMFLQRDITDASEVDEWVDDIESGEITTILAVQADESVAGYATIQRSRLPWSAHVAELRVLIATEMRGHGLGRILTGDAFALALSEGIEKMMARMTLDQRGAIAVFEGIGFRPEALMRDHVKDRDGNTHDLLVLSHEVARYRDRAG
jgi:L-amino acid N-acyltransferase YncA